MVLLDLLARRSDVEVVVAHFEHGIREDSDQDRLLVMERARFYGVPFVYERGRLGASASEAVARQARYAFLGRIKEESGAQAIITAHHEDDLLETAILNILRGTGRKGLSSLATNEQVIRPLLHVSKHEIRRYAQEHAIQWREDSTNENDVYLRNYIRRHVMLRLGVQGRKVLLQHIQRAQATNPEIDSLIAEDLRRHTKADRLDRRWFIMLPYDVSCEVLAVWLRSKDIREFDRKTIERLVVGAKVAPAGKSLDVNAGFLLKIDKASLQLSPRFTS